MDYLCEPYVTSTLHRRFIPPANLLFQAITYGFEALLVNEFHTLKGDCSTLVPQGPGYTDINHQACATIGSVAGQSFVDGNRYVELSFGYKYSNLWRVRCIASFL